MERLGSKNLGSEYWNKSNANRLYNLTDFNNFNKNSAMRAFTNTSAAQEYKAKKVCMASFHMAVRTKLKPLNP